MNRVFACVIFVFVSVVFSSCAPPQSVDEMRVNLSVAETMTASIPTATPVPTKTPVPTNTPTPNITETKIAHDEAMLLLRQKEIAVERSQIENDRLRADQQADARLRNANIDARIRRSHFSNIGWAVIPVLLVLVLIVFVFYWMSVQARLKQHDAQGRNDVLSVSSNGMVIPLHMTGESYQNPIGLIEYISDFVASLPVYGSASPALPYAGGTRELAHPIVDVPVVEVVENPNSQISTWANEIDNQ